MSMKFDFRTKLLVIVLTMSLVAVLTSDILIYTLLGVLSVYLIIQGFGRQTIKYLIVCGIFIVLRLLSGGQGITILMPEMFLFMVLRILKMVMAAHPDIRMPPGEDVAVLTLLNLSYHLGRVYPTIKLLGGHITGLDSRLPQSLIFLIGFLGDSGGLVISYFRIQGGNQH